MTRQHVAASFTAAVLTLALGGAVSGSVAEAQARGLDSLTVTYDVGGVKVIHRPSTVSDVISVGLYLLGGARQVTAATAGIEPLLLTASEYGTRSYPGEAARLAVLRTGSHVTVTSTYDWTRFSFAGIKQEFDSTWALFADRLMHPTLDSLGMSVARARLMRTLRAESESPDAVVRYLADSLAFRNHPYAVDPGGRLESLAALTADDLRKYAGEQMVTSRMLLVVVGEISRAQVEQAVMKTLGTLPRGSYTWSLPPEWPTQKPEVVVVQRRVPTNYILGLFSGPLISSKDYPAFEVATGMVGGRISSAVRSRGLSYTGGAPIIRQGATGGGVYTSTIRPDSVLMIINAAIEEVQTLLLARASLLAHGESYLFSHYLNNESTLAQGDILARAQLYWGDFHAAAEYGDAIRRIAPPDVRRVAKQYMKNIQYAYVGDTTKVPRKEMLKR